MENLKLILDGLATFFSSLAVFIYVRQLVIQKRT